MTWTGPTCCVDAGARRRGGAPRRPRRPARARTDDDGGTTTRTGRPAARTRSPTRRSRPATAPASAAARRACRSRTVPNGTGYVQRVVREMRDSGKHGHRAQPRRAGVGGRTRDRGPGAAAGPRQHRQLRRARSCRSCRAAPRWSRSSAAPTTSTSSATASRRAWAAATRVGWGTAFAAGFGRDLATIVDGMRARAPNARIILLNPPNGAGLPYVATRPRDRAAHPAGDLGALLRRGQRPGVARRAGRRPDVRPALVPAVELLVGRLPPERRRLRVHGRGRVERGELRQRCRRRAATVRRCRWHRSVCYNAPATLGECCALAHRDRHRAQLVDKTVDGRWLYIDC